MARAKFSGTPLPCAVHDAKLKLCGGMIPARCFLDPIRRRGEIRRHAAAVEENHSERVLGFGVATLSRLCVPLDRLGGVELFGISRQLARIKVAQPVGPL